jgi:hypothetical protein
MENQMGLSREELRQQLKAALLGDANTKTTEAAPAAPANTASPFAKFKRKAEVVETEPDGGAVAVADEEDEEDEDEEDFEDTDESEESVADEPETTPIDEVVERLKSLVDCIVDHGDALKSWLDTCR